MCVCLYMYVCVYCWKNKASPHLTEGECFSILSCPNQKAGSTLLLSEGTSLGPVPSKKYEIQPEVSVRVRERSEDAYCHL